MNNIYLSIEQFAKYEGKSPNTVRASVAKMPPQHVIPATGRGKKGGALLSSALLSEHGRRRFLGDPKAAAHISPLPQDVSTSLASAAKSSPSTPFDTLRGRPGGEDDPKRELAPMWLTVKDAAERWPMSARNLRRWCRDGKIAKCRSGLDGGYEIHIDALPDAAQIAYYLEHGLQLPQRLRKGYRKQASSLDDLSAEQRQAAMRWAERLTDFERLMRETGWTQQEAANAYCATEKGISPATLTARLRTWIAAGRDVAALAPKPRPGRPLAEVNKHALRWLYDHYTDSALPNKRLSAKATAVHARVKGWTPIPSLSTLERYLDRIPANVRIAKQGGAKALDDLFLPATLRDYAFPAMEIWVGDHHQFDCIVKMPDGKLARLWVTAWMDMKSRLFVGREIVLQPNSSSVAQSFYYAVKAHGSPKTLLIDNGKDYTCYKLIGTKWQKKRQRVVDEASGRYLQGAFEACGIQDVCRAIEYNAESKPIERAFRTVEEQFCAQLPGYVGRSTVERKRIEDKLGHTVEQSPDLLSAEEFIAMFERYITEVYHQSVHMGEGMRGRTPAQCMAEERGRAEVGYVPEENLAVLFLTPVKKSIQRQGFKLFGQWYRSAELQHKFFDPKKSASNRSFWVRYDPQNLETVRVYDGETDIFLGIAELKERTGFRSKDEIEARRHEHKVLRELRAAWWAQQEKLLDGDITPAERIGLSTETAAQAVNDDVRQVQGKDDKVTRIVPKVKAPSAAKARKEAAHDAAQQGEGLVKQGPQHGAKLIDLATVQGKVAEKIQSEEDRQAARLAEIERMLKASERSNEAERRTPDEGSSDIEALLKSTYGF